MPEFDPLNYHTIADTVISALFKTPLRPLPIEESFPGAGVYLLYYTGPFLPYAPIRNSDTPIYAGKAIPKGSRRGETARQIDSTNSPALFGRLKDHWQSIQAAENIELPDFQCRYLAVTQIWIGVVESLLIERFRPVWNCAVDGFGLHHVGTTRYGQRRSDWDTLHSGRAWAGNMQPGKTVQQITDAIREHFERHNQS